MAGVGRNTMSFAIPEELRGYEDERVQSGGLNPLITDGLESGAGRVLDDQRVDELLDLAVGSGE